MTIRLANDADHDAVWPILHETFQTGDTYAVDPNISKTVALDYWMTQPAATYVVETTEGIAGTYYIKTNQQGRGAHICNCGYTVSARARGQGLARQMCEHSQTEAVGLGYKAMQFNFVLASNTGAVLLWDKLGFGTIGTIPDAFDHPKQGMVDAYIMYKAL